MNSCFVTSDRLLPVVEFRQRQTLTVVLFRLNHAVLRHFLGSLRDLTRGKVPANAPLRARERRLLPPPDRPRRPHFAPRDPLPEALPRRRAPRPPRRPRPRRG